MIRANLPVALVVSDRPCEGVELLDSDSGTSVLLERRDFSEAFDRDAYTAELLELLQEHSIDLVAMAGFGTILAPRIFDVMAGRIINTHPALLPAFPGWHAVRAALEHGVKVTGCTIHVATSAVDDGPILAQEAVQIFDDDSEESLHERIKVVERRLYVETLRNIHGRGRVLDIAI